VNEWDDTDDIDGYLFYGSRRMSEEDEEEQERGLLDWLAWYCCSCFSSWS
jgi:hypothetical protein